jgi:hypothetical protein
MLHHAGPPVKKKAIENNASFAAFLGQAGVATAAPAGGEPKPVAAAKAVKKRKAPDEVPEEDVEDGAKDLAPPSAAADKSKGDKSDSKKKAPAAKKEKKAPTQKRVPAVKGKGRPKKAVKKDESASEEEEEEEEEEVVKDKSTEDSADGGDGLGEYSSRKSIESWLDDTDSESGDEIENDI